MHEVESPPAGWVLQALARIGRLSGKDDADLARRTMARRIVRGLDVDDPAFPAPRVFLDTSRFIHLDWRSEGRPGGPVVLEFLISRGSSFRGSIWRPGKPAEIAVVCDNHINGARRLVGQFWPTANSVTLGEMMALTEVKRHGNAD